MFDRRHPLQSFTFAIEQMLANRIIIKFGLVRETTSIFFCSSFLFRFLAIWGGVVGWVSGGRRRLVSTDKTLQKPRQRRWIRPALHFLQFIDPRRLFAGDNIQLLSLNLDCYDWIWRRSSSLESLSRQSLPTCSPDSFKMIPLEFIRCIYQTF